MHIKIMPLATCVFILQFSYWCHAQTDSSSFGTVLELPPETIEVDPFLIDNVQIFSDTQVNVRDGGRIGFGVTAGDPEPDPDDPAFEDPFFDPSLFRSFNIEVNVFGGGTIEGGFTANGGVTVNQLGGTIEDINVRSFGILNVQAGVTERLVTGNRENPSIFDTDVDVRLSGGEISDIDAFGGSNIAVSGGHVGRLEAINSDISITGGSLELVNLGRIPGVDVNEGSGSNSVGISGGEIDFLELRRNDRVTISGAERLGSVSGNGGLITLVGSEFAFNGSSVGAGELSLSQFSEGVLTATLADGSSHIFQNAAPFGGDRGNFRLRLASNPAGTADTTQIVIDQPMQDTPRGLRTGQTLVVRGNGSIGDDFDAVNAAVRVESGQIGEQFRIAGNEANVEISGGQFKRGFAALGGTTTISGGSFGGFFTAGESSNTSLVGGEFSLNGEAIESANDLRLNQGDTLSGTLTDGSVFIFSDQFATGAGPLDRIESINLIQGAIAPAEGTNFVVDSSSSFVPRGLRAGQVLTVRDGGNIGADFQIAGGTLNIEGGTVGTEFARSFSRNAVEAVNSQINVSGGQVNSPLQVLQGAELNVTGEGVSLMGNRNFVGEGGSANITAGNIVDLRVVSGGNATVSGGEIDRLQIRGGNAEIFGGTINGLAVTTGSTVGISGGEVDFGFSGLSVSVFQAGSNITISGGSIASESIFGLEPFSTENSIANASVDISGGEIGARLTIAGDIVNLSGGSIGDFARIESGAQLNVSGGVLGRGFNAESGSTVNVSGGLIASSFDANSGSQVSLSGGVFGRGIVASTGTTTILGGEFLLNGNEISNLASVSLGADDVLTGTFEDGNAFIFSARNNDSLNGVRLSETTVAQVQETSIVLSSAAQLAPTSLRSGQSLTVQSQGVIGNDFQAVNSTINVEGGVIGDNLELANTVFNVDSGEVGSAVSLIFGVDANVTGGSIGNNLSVGSGSVFNIEGGQVGSGFTAEDGSVVNILGGEFGPAAQSQQLSAASFARASAISDLESLFQANSGSEINIFGNRFLLDGDALDSLEIGESLLVTDRDVSLSGFLADGSAFQFNLNSSRQQNRDFFSLGSRLTISAVAIPEPASLTLLLAASVAVVGIRRRKAE